MFAVKMAGLRPKNGDHKVPKMKNDFELSVPAFGDPRFDTILYQIFCKCTMLQTSTGQQQCDGVCLRRTVPVTDGSKGGGDYVHYPRALRF
jgi:hypothetical protein